MQIHNLPAQTTAANADVLAIDNGTTTQKITAANLGKKITEDATPAYTSGDNASPSSWTSVAVMTSGEAMKNILNKVSTMFKNIRWLYKMLGTTDISSLSDAHTVTGALAKLNADLGTIDKGEISRTVCDGTPASILAWIKANYVAKKWASCRVESASSSAASGAVFGTSSFSILCNMSSQNYGYGILQSDVATHKGFVTFRVSAGSLVLLYPYEQIGCYTKSFSDISIPSNGFIQVWDVSNDADVPDGWILSATLAGFTQVTPCPISLSISSDYTKIYLLGTPNATVGSVKIRIAVQYSAYTS